MRKIPTLFRRDPDTGLRYVTREVHPDCQWVLDGEGVPTRKYDGTCVMYDGDRWWARREVKPGKAGPADFRAVEVDEVTGKAVGWEPIEHSSFARYHADAVSIQDIWLAGTYELCGPKVNGNPEGYDDHVLIRHDMAMVLHDAPSADFDLLASYLRAHGYEGIVWHHPDGRMAKLKRKDFPS